VNRWQLLKDILLTGTGIAVILSQVLSPRPSDVLLATGLALTVPSVAGHATALIVARGAGSSSGPPEPPTLPPSPRSSSGAIGE
jgi:hypothetical protein